MDDEQQKILAMLESAWARAARRLLLEEAGGTMDGNFFTSSF